MVSGVEPIIVPARGCKFITGHPGESGWSYCGEKPVAPNASWCAEHHAVVYGKAKPAKARPEKEPETKSEAPQTRRRGRSLEDPLLMG